MPPGACDAHAQVFGPFDRLLDLSLDRAGDAGLVWRVLLAAPPHYGFTDSG